MPYRNSSNNFTQLIKCKKKCRRNMISWNKLSLTKKGCSFDIFFKMALSHRLKVMYEIKIFFPLFSQGPFKLIFVTSRKITKCNLWHIFPFRVNPLPHQLINDTPPPTQKQSKSRIKCQNLRIWGLTQLY